jgi:hypothetical protein
VSDGLHTVRLVVSDTVGLQGVDSLSLMVDNTAPQVPSSLYSTSHTTATWSNQAEVTVVWTPAWDAGSGLAGYSTSWAPAPGAAPGTVVQMGPGELMTTSLPLQDGDEWTFGLAAGDEIGNWSEPIYLGPFFIDTQPPTSTVQPLSSTVAGPLFSVCWSGEDGASGVVSYDVLVRDGSGGTWTAWLSGATETCADFAGQADHTYYFECRARDQAGNVEALLGGEGEAWTIVASPASFPVYLPLVMR